MSRLDELRQRLMQLHRQRRNARLGTAWCSVLLAALWALAVLFVLDWTLELTRAQRVVALLAAAAAVYWAYQRFAAPLLADQESLVDVALLVERQQHIDSDLVAALQFETTDARRWGSPQLEEAVVEYVAEFSGGLNVFEGFNRQQMARRTVALGITTAVLILAVGLFPSHAKVFFSRLFLSQRHYPTRTQIATVWINGQPVSLVPGEEETVRCAYGLPLSIEVECTGEIPAAGLAQLATQGGLRTEIALERRRESSPQDKLGSTQAVKVTTVATVPQSKSATLETSNKEARAVAGDVTSATSDDTIARFTGSLPRLVDSLEYQLYFGDAWTEPAIVKVIPLPRVEFVLKPTPPKYARHAEDAAVASSARQFSVIEGSRVDLEVTSDKPLAEATLIIDEKSYPLERNASTAEDGRDRWLLKTAGTPLESVVGPMAYRIEAKDTDGLEPTQPIQGFLRLRADRPPRVFGAIGTRNVRPRARQPVKYNAADDFGVGEIRLHVQITREEDDMPEERVLQVRRRGNPELRVEGVYRLDLSAFSLEKGDQVTVTLEAFDDRGTREGRSSMSEPLTMFVTDEVGVLADMQELDEMAAKQFDTIIKLGIGEKP